MLQPRSHEHKSDTIWILMFYRKSGVVAMPTHKRQELKKGLFNIYTVHSIFSVLTLYESVCTASVNEWSKLRV